MATVRARFIEPMLLQQTARLPEGAQWLYEFKLDGYRAIAFKADGASICAPATTRTLLPATSPLHRPCPDYRTRP